MKRSELPEHARNLPRYSPDETCAQCGFDRITDEFRSVGTKVYHLIDGRETFPTYTSYPEIKRICLRCGASWQVLPLSIEEDKVEAKPPFVCPKCGKPGLMSTYFEEGICTECANKQRGL